MNKTEEVTKGHLIGRALEAGRWPLLGLLIIAVVSFATYAAINYYSQGHKRTSKTLYYQEAKGGDTSLVIRYHKEAVSAWKTGDKSKAKRLAKKGIDEANKLTIAQQTQIPNEMSVVFELNDIASGVYYGK